MKIQINEVGRSRRHTLRSSFGTFHPLSSLGSHFGDLMPNEKPVPLPKVYDESKPKRSAKQNAAIAIAERSRR